MSGFVFGISYRSAPIEVRERYFLSKKQIEQTYLNLGNRIDNFFILATCNRLEFCIFDDRDRAALALIWDLLKVNSQDKPYFYLRRDVEHYFFKLLLGLESFIVGEGEILGQVKKAIADAYAKGALRDTLYGVLCSRIERVQEVQRVLNLTDFQDELYTRFLINILRRLNIGHDSRVAVLGTGYIAERIVRVIGAHNPYTVFSNKNVQRAKYLAQLFDGVYLPMEQVYSQINGFDVIFSATAAPHRIIKKAKYEVWHNASQKQIFVDFSFPRDVDPAISGLAGVYVFGAEEFCPKVLSESERERLQQALEEVCQYV